MTMTLRVRFRWWFYPYIYGVVLFCRLCRASPDMHKVFYWVARAVVIELRTLRRLLS